MRLITWLLLLLGVYSCSSLTEQVAESNEIEIKRDIDGCVGGVCEVRKRSDSFEEGVELLLAIRRMEVPKENPRGKKKELKRRH